MLTKLKKNYKGARAAHAGEKSAKIVGGEGDTRGAVCSQKFKILAPFDGIFNVVHIFINL